MNIVFVYFGKPFTKVRVPQFENPCLSAKFGYFYLITCNYVDIVFVTPYS